MQNKKNSYHSKIKKEINSCLVKSKILDRNHLKKPIKGESINLDLSKHNINKKILNNLYQILENTNYKSNLKSLLNGEKINHSEKRPVLHCALRGTYKNLDKSVIKLLEKERKEMFSLADQISSGKLKGSSGKKITNIVSVGIGGSYLPIKFAYDALKKFRVNKIKIDFVYNLDVRNILDVLENIDVERTLFVFISKSFNTMETLEALNFIKKLLIKDKKISNYREHLFAVTTNQEAAIKMKINSKNILSMPEGVGGRFSLWSNVSFPLVVSIGSKNFKKLLEGAKSADSHFIKRKPENNIPINLALISYYYSTFFSTSSHAILTYDYPLRTFSSFLQQLEMESNGKSLSLDGKKIKSKIPLIIWGGEGNPSQHSFFQLLHQSNHSILSDFIISQKPEIGCKQNHKMLHANFMAQVDTLYEGFNLEQSKNLYNTKFAKRELNKALVVKNLLISNRKPVNIIYLNDISPKSLGELISLYEHKVFILGQLYGINSYDQWGVEIGKMRANNYLKN